jgi:bile acid:Na+ symporter, BASS family
MLEALIHIAIPLSICCNVFGLGLEARLEDAIFLLRRPGLLLRSLLAMNVVMVLFAVAIATFFKLGAATKIVLVVLSVSPVPPALPLRNRKGGGSQTYAIGLLVAAVLLAIIMVPGWVYILGQYFGVATHISPIKIATVVAITVLIPLFAGIVVRMLMPKIAERLAKPFGRFAGILLLVAVLPVLILTAKPMWGVLGSYTLVALAVFVLVGLFVGHIMGGPGEDERTILAFATCARHPGVALAVIGANYPDMKSTALVLVAWYFILMMLFTFPYLGWRRRSRAVSTAD